MNGFTVVEAWVMVDEDGNYVVHEDRDMLKEKYEQDIGELSGQATRIVRMTVNVPTPKVAEVIAVAPEEAAVGGLTVA